MKKLYFRLAINNIRQNKKIYIPYMLMGVIFSLVFYILKAITGNSDIYDAGMGRELFSGAQELVLIMRIGLVVVVFFSCICIFFGNSFVMKNRRRELALYEILGIGKKGVVCIILWETVFSAGIAIMVGMLGGIVADWFAIDILLYLVKQDAIVESKIALNNIISLWGVFGGIYLMILIYNVYQILGNNLIEVLYSNKHGAKEPSIKWLLLIIGCLTLGGGYYLALDADSTGKAFDVLFIAVILVIIGIYCLFMTGTVFILKLMKKNKKIYYKLENFISISNLLYRMKQNAVGMASICVISTAALLVFTAGASLYVGGEKSIDIAYPMDGKLIISSETEQTDKNIGMIIDEVSYDTKVEIRDKRNIVYSETMWTIADNGFKDIEEWLGDYSSYYATYIVPVNNYNQITNSDYVLEDNELLVFYDGVEKDRNKIAINDTDFDITVIEGENVLNYVKDESMEIFPKCLVVTSDVKFEALCNSDTGLGRQLYVGINVKGGENEQEQFINKLQEELRANNILVYKANLKLIERRGFLSIYGGVFFVGLYLGVICLCVTTIIIYYKQISEGYEDSIHYGILKKLGMNYKEAGRCIRKQVMMVFFLPLIFAIINMAVALKIIWLFLSMIIVMDFMIFVSCAVVVSLIFMISYSLVYFITSREYYKIVYID